MVDNTALSDLFKRWRHLRDQGQVAPPEQLCADHPDLVPPLKARIDAFLADLSPPAEATAATHPDTPRPSGSSGAFATEPRFFDGYFIERILGRGGMGVVYQARHPRLDLAVALKTMRGDAESDESAERFLRESRAVALLNHPYIVRLYTAGVFEGTHYFTMALVTGGSVKEHAKELFDDPRRAVAIIEKVARGVQHAHERGIIHRDLKPGNILLDAHGEPQVGDFGLAKFLNASADLTATGSMLGTVPYMAPEQLAGQSKRAGPATDIWALGIILYELLAGRRPFVAEDTVQLMQQIIRQEPPRPRVLNSGLDRSLERIILKCLDSTPARRYASAAELADDLGHWLRGEPIRARPRAWPVRLWGRVKKRPITASAVVLALAALSGYGVYAWYSDPVRPLHAIERELASGQKTELIGATGTPRWYRFRTGEQLAKLMPGREGSCGLTCSTFALVELLPNPPATGYRLEAVVSQDDGIEVGSAGLYFFHHETPVVSGKHYFVAVHFADRGSSAGQANVTLRAWWDPILTTVWNSYEHLQVTEKFTAQLGKARHLVVEVRPTAVRAFFDRHMFPEVALESLEKKAKALVSTKAGAPLPVFSPADGQHGLGLYVMRCTASFRDVTVTQLSD
jgi:serine/threonine protein kinase